MFIGEKCIEEVTDNIDKWDDYLKYIIKNLN